MMNYNDIHVIQSVFIDKLKKQSKADGMDKGSELSSDSASSILQPPV